MQYLYGPVPSRRLGKSLGVDPLPSKTCNYQCIYCQLGRTTNFTNTRKNFVPLKDVKKEMNQVLDQEDLDLDYITFVGSGEPTLYKDLKSLIEFAKELTNKPICVITNGSLLYDEEVKEALLLADVVLPTLDAGDEKAFIRINRPHPSIKYQNMVQGLIDFNELFTGKFWIEVMVMRNINDSVEELRKIKGKLDQIRPDKIDINVPIRPPAEPFAKIPDKEVISRLNKIFKNYNNINFPEEGHFSLHSKDLKHELVSILERHPMREDQIIKTFMNKEIKQDDINDILIHLESMRKIKKYFYENKIFWRTNSTE